VLDAFQIHTVIFFHYSNTPSLLMFNYRASPGAPNFAILCTPFMLFFRFVTRIEGVAGRFSDKNKQGQHRRQNDKGRYANPGGV
jgi:hypothetical protein